MKVFKFGGASVKDADGMRNVASIIEKYNDGKLLVVVSALGKTTNALEDVVKAYISNNGEAKILIEKIKQSHFDICKDLFEDKNHPVYDQLNNFFVEITGKLFLAFACIVSLFDEQNQYYVVELIQDWDKDLRPYLNFLLSKYVAWDILNDS